MSVNPNEILIYHITDVANLPGILTAQGLQSDTAMSGQVHTVIGYAHIKERRMTQIRVPCCSQRFVGEFVPFYFCPRSPMLYVINQGSTGKPPGCQRSIVHLVSRVSTGIALGRNWAISDGNAGASYPSFYSDLQAGFASLDWRAIRATDWRGVTNQKMAEFLVADFFPWQGFETIGCHNSAVAQQVSALLANVAHKPAVSVQSGWYY